jgi:hypothetical protein
MYAFVLPKKKIQTMENLIISKTARGALIPLAAFSLC